jgi:hypothetical protein
MCHYTTFGMASANVCCCDLKQLHRELIRARERLRHKKEIIKSCSRQCGYLL